MVAGGGWGLGACMVAGGMHGCWGGVVVGGMHGCGGCAWLLGGMCGCGGHAWLQQACMVAGRHAWLLGACVVAGGCVGYDEIRSMSGRYASYWNAFLLDYLVAYHSQKSVTKRQLYKCKNWTSPYLRHP